VEPGNEAAFLAPLEIRRLPGVGPKAEARLASYGIATVGELAALSDDLLRQGLPGRGGGEPRPGARGGGPPPAVAEPGDAISISSEETFDRDVDDRSALHEALDRMAVDLAGSLVRRGWVARTVTTKLRYPDFSIVTRSHSLAVGTDSGDDISQRART